MRTTATVIARPRYGLLDVIGLLFREFWIMLVIFLAVVAVGTAVVLTLGKTYTARGSVYAGVGQEYVYQPRVGATERGQTPDVDTVTQSEAALLNSRAVKERVVDALGAPAILGDKATGTPAEMRIAAIKALEGGLSAGAVTGSPIIGITYEADDPERAATVLNAVIDQYLIHRREVFADASAPALSAQRLVFEDALAEADAAYEQFLRTENIGDFAATKAALAANWQTVSADRLSTQAQVNQLTRQLATLETQLASTPPEIALQQDLNVAARDQILQLRTEREQLLARYLPDSQPIQDIEARIAGLEQYVASGQGVGVKEVRTGPNPIWVELETTRATTLAQRDSLMARLGVLDAQLGELRARQARLTAVESENATLAGALDVQSATVREFQQREAQALADQGLVKAGADDVRVMERAAPPLRGRSLKLPLLAAVILFAAFTALSVGLIRIFSRRGFTTPASVGRTLDLPVLAAAPVKVAR
jgi:polysaccharide biosynthesis protein PslE